MHTGETSEAAQPSSQAKPRSQGRQLSKAIPPGSPVWTYTRHGHDTQIVGPHGRSQRGSPARPPAQAKQPVGLSSQAAKQPSQAAKKRSQARPHTRHARANTTIRPQGRRQARQPSHAQQARNAAKQPSLASHTPLTCHHDNKPTRQRPARQANQAVQPSIAVKAQPGQTQQSQDDNLGEEPEMIGSELSRQGAYESKENAARNHP